MRFDDPQLAAGAALLGAATLGGIALWVGQQKKVKPPQGKIKCSPESTADITSLRLGDYVIIDLAAVSGKFHELTWARIIGATKQGMIQAKLVGESGEYGQPKPLSIRQHGFEIGQVVTFAPNCVIEIYRPVPKPGRVLCGQELPVKPAENLHTELLGTGDYVELFVKSREGEPERLWTQVVEFSPQQQVIYAIVYSTPKQEDHGFKRGDQIIFLRDCIINISFDVPPVEVQ